MKVAIQCQDCGKKLVESDTFATAVVGEIKIRVKPCGCAPGAGEDTNKSTCENCEDLATWRKRAEEAEAKLEYLKQLLNENEPAQPDNPVEVKTHATPSDEDKPGQHDLQSTPDVESTGGYKVPGIRKNSADGVVSDY